MEERSIGEKEGKIVDGMEDLKREKGRIGRKEYRRKGRKRCRWDGRKGGKRGRWAGRNNRRIVQGVRDWKGRKGAGIR